MGSITFIAFTQIMDNKESYYTINDVLKNIVTNRIIKVALIQKKYPIEWIGYNMQVIFIPKNEFKIFGLVFHLK